MTTSNPGAIRGIVTLVITALAVLGLGLYALCLGDLNIPVKDVISALAGTGQDSLTSHFVLDQRLPRVLAAVVVGAALGMSGALTQSLTRNVLGSPDIIGFSGGASVGAVVTILIVGAAPLVIAFGALVGGIVTAMLVVGLSWTLREGRTNGSDRLVVIGIAVAAACHALTTLLVARAPLTIAQDATMWLTGSLSTMTWRRVVIALLLVLVVSVAVASLRRGLDVLRYGDDIAQGLGVRVAQTRTIGTLLAVALCAVGVATGGPIGFIALAAPHIFRLIARVRGLYLAGSALVGALLLLVADMVAQRAFAPTQLPVGVVTGVIGGVYLVVLLVMTAKQNRGIQG